MKVQHVHVVVVKHVLQTYLLSVPYTRPDATAATARRRPQPHTTAAAHDGARAATALRVQRSEAANSLRSIEVRNCGKWCQEHEQVQSAAETGDVICDIPCFVHSALPHAWSRSISTRSRTSGPMHAALASRRRLKLRQNARCCSHMEV
eukprot:1912908-Prymnesium_polylepis.4